MACTPSGGRMSAGRWPIDQAAQGRPMPRTSEPFAEHRHELNRRLRAAFLAGAEDRFRAEHGRGLTESELRRVMQRHPGDLRTEIDPAANS
jgi:hypothetical protein